ncbi:MAG TPA: hypothetical protein VES42_03380, partial [Pilimelia sp.]|nr:hypothetical protein [Pilimelia sp.]
MALPMRVAVSPDHADAAPGDSFTVDATVRNTSDVVEHYVVEVLGLPPGGTARAEPETIKLRPGESGAATVRVAIPADPPSPAGHYRLGILVSSKYRPEVSRCEEIPLQLAAVESVTVRAEPEVVTGKRTARYTVDIVNGGNVPVRLRLAATDPERRVAATFQPPAVDLPPRGATRVHLDVRAPVPWKAEKQRRITIEAVGAVALISGALGGPGHLGGPGAPGGPGGFAAGTSA